MNDLPALKAAARKAAFTRRAAAHAAGHPAPCALLSNVLSAHYGKIIAGYMPMRSEIDPLPAMAIAARHGPVCVPVIIAPAAPLRFARWTPESVMVAGDFGALIPENPVFIIPDVVIVPLVAFDRHGGRLGYGGGFYDRTLEQLRPRVTAIGFAWAAQEADALPLETTDQPLDLIVTENAVLSRDAMA